MRRTGEPAPVAYRGGHELRAVVAADVLRLTALCSCTVEDGGHVVRGDRTCYAATDAFAGVLVAHAEYFDGSAIAGGIEEKVQRPHVIPVRRNKPLRGHCAAADPVSLQTLGRHAQPLGVVSLHAAVLVAPAMVCIQNRLQRPSDDHRLTLAAGALR